MNIHRDRKSRNPLRRRVLKWLRIAPRRRYRLTRSSLGHRNRRRSKRWQDRARETSELVAIRAREQVEELRADTHDQYVKAKPQLERVERVAREQAESALASWKRWLRISASIIASTALIVIVALAFFFITAISESGSTELTCDDCPVFTVTRVIDGDTIDTSGGRIRIYGADTPEQGEKCFSEATEEMRRLAGDQVRGEPGPRLTDPFNRSLFYLYTDSGESIDELLIRNGFAVAWTQDGQYRDLLVETEFDARRDRVGCLWK